MHELHDHTPLLGSCSARGWWDAHIGVSIANLNNNLLFELEDLGHTGALDAVSVYMWAGSIPLSRRSEYATHRSHGVPPTERVSGASLLSYCE